MAAYADFTYYSTEYLGTAIASADFPRLALRATAIIDQITFNRAVVIMGANTPESTVTAIQNAVCAVAEEIQTQEQNGNIDGVTNESVGSHSMSYGKGARSAMTNLQKQIEAAKVYLGNTGLMFPGFKSGEYGGQVSDE